MKSIDYAQDKEKIFVFDTRMSSVQTEAFLYPPTNQRIFTKPPKHQTVKYS